jgi:hypothetical protein
MEAMLGQLFGDGKQQRRVAIRARAMGQDHAGFVAFAQGWMQEAVDSIVLDEFGH